MNTHSQAKSAALTALAAAYWCGCATLAFFGIGLWRTYCEGFGCAGLGIAWFMWSCAYALILLAGLVASRTRHETLKRCVRVALAIQFLAGAGLLVYWAVRSMA